MLEKDVIISQVAAVVRMVLLGLNDLHAQGKIHRDIKSANILLDTKGVCKLADLGLAAQLSLTMPMRRSVVGSPYWMPPEVLATDAKYNESADIWSMVGPRQLTFSFDFLWVLRHVRR